MLLKIFPRNEKAISFITKMSSESEQTAVDLADLTLDDFKTWTTINLNPCPHLRGKNSEEGQESLAAKTFFAVIKSL